jgi:hypothetical protein
MYPATPGADTLAVNGPQFPSVLLQRPGGNITINSAGSGGYVQGLKVNGTATSHNFLRYPDIAGGGTLDYTMGGSPSTSWGTGAGDVPPSFQDGATPVPTAPSLGTNLAKGKATTTSAACATAESGDKAVDGSLKNNSKWCSNVTNPTLTVDLGSAQTVGSFVVKHAGLGGENTSWNTGAFQIQTSTDNSTWSSAVSVSGSRSSRTYHTITPRQARYVRLAISAPTNTGGDTAARIYELEVYGQSSGAGAHAITGLAGKCVDIANSGTANGTHVQLYDCNGSGAQQWTVGTDGTVTALGKCLDDANSGTADGSLVQLWDCNGTNAQKWTVSGQTLVNAAANKCLDVPGSNTANGTQLDVWTCNGGANQNWSVS